MLKTIDPLLNADILYALQAMGHGDELVICDAYFPALAVAQNTILKNVLRMDGSDAPRAVRALFSLFPLDTFVEKPVLRMEVVGEPDTIVGVQSEVQAEIDRAEGRKVAMGSLERFAFYERAKQSFAVLQTGETRPYSCFILKKGSIDSNSPVQGKS